MNRPTLVTVIAALCGLLILSNGCGPEPASPSATPATNLAPQPSAKTAQGSRPKLKRKTGSLIDAKPGRDMKPRENL